MKKTPVISTADVVVGLDLSLRSTGVCVNDIAHNHLTGILLEEKKLLGAARLSSIRHRILDTLYTYRPSLVAIEGYSFGSMNRLADIGELGGVVQVELQELHIPFIVVSPKMLKKFVTGSGSASKETVIKAVASRYGYVTGSDDIADATALAKFAEVYITQDSSYRSELAAVKKFTLEKKQKVRYKKVFSL